MEDAVFSPIPVPGTALDSAMDSDYMDELLLEGCWLETMNGSEFLQQSPPSFSALFDSPFQWPASANIEGNSSAAQLQKNNQVDMQTRLLPRDSPTEIGQAKPLDNPQSLSVVGRSSQSDKHVNEGSGFRRKWWIGPRVSSDPTSSVVDRLIRALDCIQRSTKDKDVLIQIWVPVNRGNKRVLTTNRRAFSTRAPRTSFTSPASISFAGTPDTPSILFRFRHVDIPLPLAHLIATQNDAAMATLGGKAVGVAPLTRRAREAMATASPPLSPNFLHQIAKTPSALGSTRVVSRNLAVLALRSSVPPSLFPELTSPENEAAPSNLAGESEPSPDAPVRELDRPVFSSFRHALEHLSPFGAMAKDSVLEIQAEEDDEEEREPASTERWSEQEGQRAERRGPAPEKWRSEREPQPEQRGRRTWRATRKLAWCTRASQPLQRKAESEGQ